MKHIIDIHTWERRDNYMFFRNFLNSWFSLTTEIECGEAFAAAKASGRSFFIYYLYAILRAVNEVPEMRYRIDKEGNVAFYDELDIITPIQVPGRTFHTVRIPYNVDFEQFYATAYQIIHNIPADGDPYGEEQKIMEQGDYDVMHLSAVPKLWFSSLTFAQSEPVRPTEYPLSVMGKATMRDGQMKMPYAIFVNHAFVDGAHITEYLQKVDEYLKLISK